MKSSWLIGGLSLFLSVSSGYAEDHFLTIGGGYSPTGNQISLEKNVFFFQSLLSEAYSETPSHQILFADGDDPGRDLQFIDPEHPIPRANALMALINRQTKNLNYAYRDHQIEDVYGASSRENLQNWFEKVGAGLEAGDRLIIYATAHGGRGEDNEDPTNTKLFLWNNQSVTTQEFSAMLDQVSPDVPVVLVMVQCYAGGFADLIFDGGSSENGVTSSNLCGFFATVHDRVAAGCTADIKEEDYHEYSTYFLAALRGLTRTGSPIEPPDFDGDGIISFEEAHAYSLIHSPTIDVPIKTSDTFLREFSRTNDDNIEGLLSGNSPLGELLEIASPCDRAVIEQLLAELEIDGQEGLDSKLEELEKNLMREKRGVSRRKRSVSSDLSRRANSIKNALLRRWPELANSWNPEVHRLLSEDSDTIIGFVEQHRDYARLTQLQSEQKEIAAQEMDFDRRWVKCHRLRRTLHTVALTANLPRVADQELVDRYQRLLASERQSLGSSTSLADSSQP